MGVMEEFGAYAAAFEETFRDDDWNRLRKYFDDAAVYEVSGAGFDCRLEGPDAILSGLKKSLDGFDRRFDSRKIDLVSEPELTDDSMQVDWTVTYTLGDAPSLVLRGHTEARLADGRIRWMRDSYTDEMSAEAAEWVGKHAPGFDGSYV